MRGYGFPDLYKNAARASETIAHITYLQDMDGRVVSMREAWKLAAEVVEVNSGRREIRNRRTVVVDKTKPNFRRVVKHLSWFQAFVEECPLLWLAMQTELFPVEIP